MKVYKLPIPVPTITFKVTKVYPNILLYAVLPTVLVVCVMAYSHIDTNSALAEGIFQASNVLIAHFLLTSMNFGSRYKGDDGDDRPVEINGFILFVLVLVLTGSIIFQMRATNITISAEEFLLTTLAGGVTGLLAIYSGRRKEIP